MAIEQGISDLRTIKRYIRDVKGDLSAYEVHPCEAHLRRLGNMAGLVSERIAMRRRPLKEVAS